MITATFYIFSAFAIVSLWMMLRSREIVHAISWFAVFLIIIAVFFGLLRAPFLALGQLIVFTGGMIAILLIGISFSGMPLDITRGKENNTPRATEGSREVNQKEYFSTSSKNNYYKIISLFFLLTLLVSIKLFFARDTLELPVKTLSLQLFGTYWLLIAIIMLMFLAALLSAVYFLKKGLE